MKLENSSVSFSIFQKYLTYNCKLNTPVLPSIYENYFLLIPFVVGKSDTTEHTVKINVEKC
jgi:hypothetical protein